VDVERGAAREDAVHGGEHLVERLHGRERAVAGRVQVREIDHRPHPPEPRRDPEDVVEAAEVVDPAHDLDPERDPAVLGLDPLAEVTELGDDRSDRLLAGPAEQEAGMEDHRLGSRDLCDPRRVVEHPGRHPVLAVALDMAHEAGDRRVHREGDPPLAGELPELLGPRVVHPEPGLEVDLVRRVPALAQQLDRLRGRFP